MISAGIPFSKLFQVGGYGCSNFSEFYSEAKFPVILNGAGVILAGAVAARP